MQDTTFWETKAAQCLAALQLAAELAGANAASVAEWARGDVTAAEMVLREHGYQAEADLVAGLRDTRTPRSTASVRLIMCRLLAAEAG
jgi:hypothetical protein